MRLSTCANTTNVCGATTRMSVAECTDVPNVRHACGDHSLYIFTLLCAVMIVPVFAII